ncbi:hypothetical protein [Fiji disease virus]|uniref:Inner capsid protein S2 n=1 Tax=Fiji disease virus (isolate Sugarcane) TaxID=648172 RepID=CAPSD_FDVS|nr:hypothetical protein [Fiji disease virus]Q9YX48.1 RecName: Full=Putative major capsid protein [Fiji disease virus isolate Sugarcane]AAD02490.1 unknown [Fiji disease virus]
MKSFKWKENTEEKDDEEKTNEKEQNKPKEIDSKTEQEAKQEKVSEADNSVKDQEGITNKNRPEDISYVDDSTIQAKTALTVEAITNIKGHLIESDQKLADERASQYLQTLTNNAVRYTTTFGISEISDEILIPYYHEIDFQGSDKELPSLFSFETFVNEYYGTDLLTYENEKFKTMMCDHPALSRSSEIFKVNAYKISIKWTGETFNPSIGDPSNIGTTSLIKNIAYVGVHNSDNYKDRKLYSRLKMFLELAANCNIILKGCATRPLGIDYELTKVSKKLNGAKILYNDKAHIIYNGIYHPVTPFCDKVNDILKEGDVDIDFGKIFKYGREVVTKINTYDILNKGYAAIDQFTAYLINMGMQRLLDHRMNANSYKDLTQANYPSRVSLHVFDTLLDEFLYVYKPTDQDWEFCLFVIMIDKEVRSLIMAKTKQMMLSRNLFGQSEIGLKLTNLITRRVQGNIAKNAADYFINVMSSGSIESLCNILCSEMYARFSKFNIECSYLETEYLDLFKFLEILLAFIITPRLAWWNSHKFGKHLYDLMSVFCRSELIAYEARYGCFIKFERSAWVKVDKHVSVYGENDLYDGIYFSFLISRTYSAEEIKAFPFISKIYSLIEPLGDYINLDRKTRAKYPFFETTVRGYLPCSIISYTDITTNNPVNTRVNNIGASIIDLSQRYFTHKPTKTSTKEAYDLILDTIGNTANNLGILMHSTVAPMLATLYDTFLFFADGFNKTSPWVVPRKLGYSGYNVYADRNKSDADRATYLIGGRAIVIPRNLDSTNSMIYTYIGIFVHGVVRCDMVTSTGSYITSSHYDPDSISIMPFNGSEITTLALKVVNHSKRINTVFTLFNYLHSKSTDEILSPVRERLSKFWTTSNARALLNEITRIFNCPIERYFTQMNAYDTMHSDPRVYKPTLYSVSSTGNIDSVQPANCAVNKQYEFGDTYLNEMLKVISHVAFDDELPLFRQTEGLVCGYFTSSSNSPDDYFSVDEDTLYFSIDLDEHPEVFTTVGTNGFSIQLQFKKGNDDHAYTNPMSKDIPSIKFLINRIGNLNAHFVQFINRMLSTQRHLIVLRKVVVDYNVITLGSWNDYTPTSSNVFDQFVKDRDLINIKLDFYDTRFIIQNQSNQLLSQYLFESYRNITPLKDFVVMGGIFGNPNRAESKLTDINKDIYCFGDDNDQTTKYFTSKKSKRVV